jgi:hypothetical protein
VSIEVKSWSPNQLAFITWLATPAAARNPRTQAEFAEEIGVRPETLSRWKRDPDLIGAAGDAARELLGEDLPDIYAALVRKAKQGSFAHVKLALELAGHYVERREHTGAGGEPLVFTVGIGAADVLQDG